jgi:hypothetical protein
LSQEQRWAAIAQGLDEKKTNRRIAKELKCDESTIRREIKKMNLSLAETRLMREGHPAERFLRAAQASDTARRSQNRVEQERVSGSHSTETAEIVLKWLCSKQLGQPDTMYVVQALEREFWPVGNSIERARVDGAHTLASLESSKEPTFVPYRIEYCLRVLRIALPRIAPEKLIRDNAFPKMTAALEDAKRRRRMLVPPPRPGGQPRFLPPTLAQSVRLPMH